MKIEDFCDTKNEQIKTTNVRSAGKRKKAKLHGILPLVWRRHRSYLQVIMTPEDLFKRLRDLAYNIVKLCGDLPPGNLSRIITFQILKSSFSAAANYRAACRGQSPKSFISKLSISFEESDETQFWLESIYDLEMLPP